MACLERMMEPMNTSEKIWRQYHSRLRAFIKSRIIDDATGEDILQSVFLKIHVELAYLKDETKLKSWLYQITRNAIIDYLRLQNEGVDPAPTPYFFLINKPNFSMLDL